MAVGCGELLAVMVDDVGCEMGVIVEAQLTVDVEVVITEEVVEEGAVVTASCR